MPYRRCAVSDERAAIIKKWLAIASKTRSWGKCDPGRYIDIRREIPCEKCNAYLAGIQRLIYNCIGVILITRSGLGKRFSVLRKDTTSNILLPLNEIAKEQVQNVNQIGGSALCLNADAEDTHKGIKLAKYAHYTLIFFSPELANTSPFRDVLRDPEFNNRLTIIVVHDAHLIVQRGI